MRKLLALLLLLTPLQADAAMRTMRTHVRTGGAGASGGGGASHPTLDASNTSVNIALSNGNLTASWINFWGIARTPSASPLSGKKYWEATLTSAGGGVAVAVFGVSVNSLSFENVLNTQSGDRSGWRSGNIWSGAGVPAAPTIAVGDTLGFAYDSSTRTIWYRNAGGWVNSGDPVAATNGFTLTLGTGGDVPSVSIDSGAASITMNFGASAFAYTPPTGYSAP